MIVARGFGLSPISGAIAAMGLGIDKGSIASGHSGTARLWMYELYAKSIEEDHKKRGLIKEEKPIVPQSEPTVAKKPKTKARRQATRPIEHSGQYKPLPHYAPVFKIKSENDEILNEIDAILDSINKSPLNRLKPIESKKVQINKNEIEALVVSYEEFKVKKKRKRNIETLLLLAA